MAMSEAATSTLTSPVPATGRAAAIGITPRAARRIAELIAAEGASGPAPSFRIQVAGGGCSGFQYNFALDRAVNADDTRIAAGGVAVVVDEASLGLLAGSELDWVETLAGASFRFSNPNAASSCGCGHSFSV